jgi:hypothetical protein
VKKENIYDKKNKNYDKKNVGNERKKKVFNYAVRSLSPIRASEDE